MSAALLRAFAAVRRPPHTRAPFANASRFCSDNAKPPTARTAVERLHTGVDAMPNGRIPPPMGMPSGASVEMEHAVFTDTPLIFDTHRMITYLTQAGFSQPQSVAITDAMARAVVPPPPSNVNDTDLPRIVRCQGAHVLIT
ncbi:unnamed protein product [Agarophyton chilense]